MKRRGRRGGEEEGEEEEKRKGMEFVKFCMDFSMDVWVLWISLDFVWILVWKYGFLMD